MRVYVKNRALFWSYSAVFGLKNSGLSNHLPKAWKKSRSSFFTACFVYCDNLFDFIDQNSQPRLSPDELVKAALDIEEH